MSKREVKIFWIIVVALLLCGCSAKNLMKRAVKKDPSVVMMVSDTIQFTQIVEDTIYNSDSTFYIERRIMSFDTIISYQKYDFSEMKGWFQSWQENKTERTVVRHTSRVKKTEIKQDNRTQRNTNRNDRKEANNVWKWISALILAVFSSIGLLLFKMGFLRKQNDNTI